MFVQISFVLGQTDTYLSGRHPSPNYLKSPFRLFREGYQAVQAPKAVGISFFPRHINIFNPWVVVFVTESIFFSGCLDLI